MSFASKAVIESQWFGFVLGLVGSTTSRSLKLHSLSCSFR